MQTAIFSFVHLCVYPYMLCPVPSYFSQDYSRKIFTHFTEVCLSVCLSVISRVLSIPAYSPIDKICDLHLKACKIVFMEILIDPTHPLRSAPSFSYSHAFIRSEYKLISSSIDVYRN